MASPTRSILSPTAARLTTIIPNTTVISPRSFSTRSQLEESITTLQNEQERVQKKTFTKWVNIYLSLHEPPYFINDLFEDLKDGTKLIALLEVLSGQTLPIERGNKRAHCLSNVDNALKYLESRKIKLVNIRPIDIVDGKPMMILGLIWMLILCYQIEDANMSDEDSKDNRSKAKEALLEWVRKKTSGFHSSSETLRQIDGLDVRDFTSSWRDGLAFNALIHGIRPDLVDLRRVTRMDPRERLENAFTLAEQYLGVPRLIDAEDVDVNKPDEKSIMTYLAQFSRRFPDLPFGSINKEHGELLRWVTDTRQRLTLVIEAPIRDIQAEYRDYVKQLKEFVEKQKQWKAFERKESKSPNFPGEKLNELRDLFNDITLRMNRWRFKLDTNLPGELGQIADWINTAEEILARKLSFDPLKSSPEENIQRFNKLNEEYAAIFTDKEVILTTFQRLKRDPSVINKQISSEHLNDLDDRLQIIMTTSEERGRYLDFEEMHWKVQSLFAQLEFFIVALSKKQGDINQTEKLYNEYKRKIHDEKLLTVIESLLPELTRKAQHYSQLGKKDDHTAREFLAYCETIRRTVKSASLDLKAKEQMLQETIHNWKIYHNLYDSLEKWLNEGERVLRRSSEEKLNYFTTTDHWSQIHEKLRVAIERLISVCDEEFATVLHNKLLFINRRWKEIIESVQQFKHDESIKKKRDDFYAGRAKLLDTLDKIDREMQTHLPCTIRALKEQENRLYDAQAELEMFNQTVQVLSKLSQTIARESGESNASNEMNSLLQICFDKLHHVQEYLPITLKRNKIMLGHLQKFEDGLQKCQQWLTDAKHLISRYSVQVSVKQIEDFLEQHRNFFSEIGYYQSVLENKAKLISTMKKSNENLVALNFAPVDEQYKQLTDTFEQIRQQTSYWEKEFTQHTQLWRDFHQRLKHLEEWIDQAQTVVQEKHDDVAYLIQKHKTFFQIIDDEILHGFIKSGRELFHIRNATEQKEIQFLMDTLQSRWNTIVCFAPVRLLRLQYERMENIIVQELKQAEDELNDELRQLEKHRDTTDILRRHHEHFQGKNFHPTIETYMRNLHACASDIRSKDTGTGHENEQIDQRTIKLNEYWTRMQAKIDNVKRKLQTIPKKWQEFEEKSHLVETWMNTIERSMHDTQNTDVSFEQYKAIVTKFKGDVQQIDTVSHDVRTITALLDDLIEERATDEPARYRQRLDTLLARYKQLLAAIDVTSRHCAVIIPAKMIHENSQQLNSSLAQISNAPIHFRDLADVRTALQGQMKVCDVLAKLAHQVNELVTRGNELLRQPNVPKYVQQDVQNVQRFYNEKVQTGDDFLEKLKRLLDLWERFDANQRRYHQQTDRLNSELSQLKINRNSITSYENEIDNCKHIRNSYADLKSVLDENADHLQAISSNNLLPYENLQKLKVQYDQLVEDFVEKLRLIDELLQELLHDNNKWIRFNDELKRLETLFREIGSMFDAKMFGERPLEDKQQILERIRTELGEHLHSLSILHSDGASLEALRSRPKDLQHALGRLSQLRSLAETTSGKVNREEEQVAECRTHVQASQRCIQQLHPWLDHAEAYLGKRLDQIGALNLTEAKHLYDQHKEFLEERRRLLLVYNNLMNEEQGITDQYDLKSSIKSLSSRWNEIIRKSDELTPRYDKQYSSWLLFESELNSFRDQILSQLEQRVHPVVSIDLNKLFDLNRLNTLLGDLRVLDESIHNHTSNYNRFHKQLTDLRQYTSAEGQRTLHEEQMSIETRWHQINRTTTDKLREAERLYESRKSFHNRFEMFERSVRDLSEQIENHAQLQTTTCHQTLQRLQQIQKQLQTVKPLVATIGQEFVEFELSGIAQTDLQTIQNTFDTQRQRLHTYEIVLDKRLELLKRYEEHMTHSTEIRTKLQQIHDDLQQRQQMKISEIDLIKSQVERYGHDLSAIRAESHTLDRLMEESGTTMTDPSTNRSIFFAVESRTIENLLDTIENKLVQRRIQAQELERLLEDFSQVHTNLLYRISTLSNNLRTARLIGYSPRDIEELMVIVKTLSREIQNEETHLQSIRGKYKTFASDLTTEEQEQAQIGIKKIEVELGQLQEQIEKRQERLTTLFDQRQELDQTSNRLLHWYDDKQRFIDPEQTIPLKSNEIERVQKKLTDIVNELKTQRATLDQMIKLNEQVKRSYSYENQTEYDLHPDDLVRKFNRLEETLNDRTRQLTIATDQRRDCEQLMSKLTEWLKSIEQQIKDPLANDLQQTASVLKEKSKTIQSLLQSSKDRLNEFDDLTRLYSIIVSTLNDADRITLDERYTLLKEKYNRLLDTLTQRLALLDEASHERNEFDRENEHVQKAYQQLHHDFLKIKQQTPSDPHYSSNERRLESYEQCLTDFQTLTNRLKDLTRVQRLLTGKGHRIDFRSGGELSINLKNLDGQIHHEIERLERASQTQNEFHHLEKEIDSQLQSSAEQFKSAQQHPQEKSHIYQTIVDRLQQTEHVVSQLSQLNERLSNDLPRSQHEQNQRSIERRQERLQILIQTSQQARGEHEHLIKSQQKLTDDLISIEQWFRKVIQDFLQPLEFNLSLNNLNDYYITINQLGISIDQRLARLDQLLADEPTLINSDDGPIRERLNTVEELKHQVKTQLTKQRVTLDDIHERMSEYLKLTTEIKAAVCDADFKLAPFLDGYDRHRLNEHEKELNSLEGICAEQNYRLVEAHKLVETFRSFLRTNAKDSCENQLRSFHQTVEDLETRIHQRRKELEDIRQKSSRFVSSVTHLQTDANRILHLIEKSPDNAENLVSEMDSTFSALQYLGRDLKKSLDLSSSTEIDRELKDVANSVDTVRDSLDRMKKSHEENESLHDRIERLLSKIKSFIQRKRQEAHSDGSDLNRMKTLIKDLELEQSHFTQMNELISTLAERRYDSTVIRSLESKGDETFRDLQSLKSETMRVIDNLNHQLEEQEKLRLNARNILSVLQRTKVQLIELRPTMNNEANQKLQKIDEDLVNNSNHFDRSLDDYREIYGHFPDDLDRLILRVSEELEDLKIRLNDKASELTEYNVLRHEYETSLENISKMIQLIETKTRTKLNLDLLKGLAIEMQRDRSLFDRLQILSSTLASQLTDANERERLRRRLTELTHRWTELEHNLITEEETITEQTHLTQQFTDIQSKCERWCKQSKELTNELTNAKTVKSLEQVLPKARTLLVEYSSLFDLLQRLKSRTPKLPDIDRLQTDLTVHRDQLEQRLDISSKMYTQFNDFHKQYSFYEQWIDQTHRTIDTVLEQTSNSDEKVKRFHEIQIELEKRKQLLQNLSHDYPQISSLIGISNQTLLGNLERTRGYLQRKKEECEEHNRQQKEFRTRIESFFDWIKQTHRHEPFTGGRDNESLQREQTRLNDQQQQLTDKSKEIDALLRTINNSKLPSDSLQRLRHEIDHLRERLTESSNEIQTRSTFLKKTIRDVNEQRTHRDRSLVEQKPSRSVEEALNSLTVQMGRVENENEERERRHQQHQRDWQLFHNEMNLLQEKLNTFKQRKTSPQDSIEEQLHFLRKQNEELDHYQETLSHLRKHAETLSLDDDSAIPLPAELQIFQSLITFLKQQFDQRCQSLFEAEHNLDLYLNECKTYDDLYNIIVERLSRSSPLVSSSDDYVRQINEQNSHQQQINDKRRQLTVLYEKLDRGTRTRYTKQYDDMERRSNDLQNAMIEQRIHCEYLLRIWRESQLRLTEISHQLEEIHKQILTHQHPLCPFSQIQTLFQLYKDLKQRLTLIEPDLFHLNDEIQTLARQFPVPSLQNDIQTLKENFTHLHLDIREKYDSHKNGHVLSNDIKRHLLILEETLGQCTTESRTRLDGTTTELERLMDVEKRLDHLGDISSNTLLLINRLKSFHLYDLQTVENQLESFHRQWTTLKTEIVRNETILHQNIISSLPSRQASKEIVVFIDTIKRFLDDDHGTSINNKETLQKLLKRYRDIRVDVFNHQRIVDFLNESLQQESYVDSTHLEYLENIKQINIDWIRIKSLISARIDTLEQLNDRLNEFDRTIRTLSDWVEEQTSDLEFMRRRHAEAGVKDNLRKCNEMEYQLTSKQQILTSLKSSLSDQDGIIQNLRQMFDHLSPSIEQVKLQSKSFLIDWQEYHRVLLQLDKILQEAQAEIDRIEISTMNVETYDITTRKAQEYLQTMESRRHDYEKIILQSRQFSDQCDQQSSSKIDQITEHLKEQWRNVEQRLKELVKCSRETVEHWRAFNHSYVHLLDRLSELEARWFNIQKEKFTSDIHSLLHKAKDFDERLKNLEREIVQFHQHSQRLNNDLPSVIGKKISTQYSLIENQYVQFQEFQKKLLKDCDQLKSREKVYFDHFNDLTQTITHTQTLLKSDQLNVKQLQDLNSLLQSKQNLIEHLNSNEYLLYMKRAKDLHQSFVDYSHCLQLIKRRLKQIELNSSTKLVFDRDAQKWNEFLQAIEQNLVVVEENLHTSCDGLIEIETNLFNTINHFNQRQQEFNRFINQGKQNIENQTISLQLEQRSHNIITTLLKRQEQIKHFIKIWLSYQNYLQNYHRLLKTKSDQEQQQLQRVTIQMIKQIEQSSSSVTDNEELKNLLEKIHQTNRQLIEHSDPKTQTILHKEWNDLQISRDQIEKNIKQRSQTLFSLLLRYNELDRTLDDLSVLIKSIRSLQQQSTQDLQLFLTLCQNKNRELTQHRTELQRVRQAINEISSDLHPDDTRQLIDKVNLLEIQWSDAECSLSTLIDGLTRHHSNYQHFEQKFLRFLQWFEYFQNKEFDQRLDGLTLQTTLNILQNDIQIIILDKRKSVNDLFIQSQLLQSQLTDSTQLQTIQLHTQQLQQMINTIEQQLEKRIRKTELTLKMFNEFEQGQTTLDSWIDSTQSNLQRLVLNNQLHSQQQTISSIEHDLDKHSTILHTLLALGQNLLNENELRPKDVHSLTKSIQTLEQRWISLKDIFTKTKLQLETIHHSYQNLDEEIQRISTIITDHEQTLKKIKTTPGEELQDIRHEYQQLQILNKSLDRQEKDIEQITKHSSTLDHQHPLHSRIKHLKHRYQTLNNTLQETMKNLKYILSVHEDFELTHNSLTLWLTDLDVLLTNLEHLSEAPINDKLQQLNNIDREIQEKQTKIEYVQTSAQFLLNKTVDARGLTINMNQLAKFCQQLTHLTNRIHKLKHNLRHSIDRRSHIDDHGILNSTSRSDDLSELDDRQQSVDQLLADVDDLLLQIKADFTSKEQNLQSPTPVGVQTDNLPLDFSYNQLLISTRRKIDALHQLIRQIQQESRSFLPQDLTVQDVMKKWNYLQILANEKDDQLQQHRQQWNDFKRQLDHLEHLSSRTNYSNSNGHPRTDEVAIVLKSTSELADDFSDDSQEWILVEHRLQSIKDKLHFSSHRPSSRLKFDLREELIEINSQLDHLESLTHSLEPVDDYEINANVNRTKLHRFIRIHDDLEIVNDRLLHLNDQHRMSNDLKIVADRLNTIKRLVRIYLEQLEKLLAQHEFNQTFSRSKHSPLRSSNSSLHRVHQ